LFEEGIWFVIIVDGLDGLSDECFVVVRGGDRAKAYLFLVG